MNIRPLFAVCAAALVAATPALARSVEGVTVADTATLNGKALKLNGAGVRTKFIFKVYVAALYVESTSKDASELIKSDQVKRVTMSMLRDLDKKQIAEAIREGFSKNSAAQMPALKDRLDKLIEQIPDVKNGQQLSITYTPGVGTTVSGAGEKAVVQGKDFADALFSVWLGQHPVDDHLKKAMLGQ